MHIISQHYVLMAIKEALNPYKKRQDFDYIRSLEMFERLILENDIKRFNEI